MNTKSLTFQLTVWHAVILTACFVVLGFAIHFGLQKQLEESWADVQMKRAHQMASGILRDAAEGGLSNLKNQIDRYYSPGANNRFARVTRSDGTLLYVSGDPKDNSFDADAIPPARPPFQLESVRQVSLGGGRAIMLASQLIETSDGTKLLVEAGMAMDVAQATVRDVTFSLTVGLIVAAGIAALSGWVLVKRAMRPVDHIAATAASISSHNLNERLPVAKTGDELERLSIALNQMITRLDEAFETSRRFVADASHELRTPLTILRGELEGIMQGADTRPQEQERIGSLLEEVERLTHIVEGLFAISRLDAGEAQAEWVRFDLAKLVDSTADQMALLAEDKAIGISRHTSEAVWIQGDRARLKQVIVNLLDNAIKYTLPGGRVRLEVSATKEGRARLSVADTGIGIPKEALGHVFDRFFRVDKARSRDVGGAGLGLAIVKSIVNAHSGKVGVDSMYGDGSCFWIELPLA